MLLSPTPETMKVLVVEQEPHRRAAISECLGKNGYAVIEAADSRAALTTLEHSSGVRVVVADIDMSDPPSGLAFAFEVHHRWPELGMVITSGHVRHLRPEEVPGGAYFVPRPLPIWLLR